MKNLEHLLIVNKKEKYGRMEQGIINLKSNDEKDELTENSKIMSKNSGDI